MHGSRQSSRAQQSTASLLTTCGLSARPGRRGDSAGKLWRDGALSGRRRDLDQGQPRIGCVEVRAWPNEAMRSRARCEMKREVLADCGRYVRFRGFKTCNLAHVGEHTKDRRLVLPGAAQGHGSDTTPAPGPDWEAGIQLFERQRPRAHRILHGPCPHARMPHATCHMRGGEERE